MLLTPSFDLRRFSSFDLVHPHRNVQATCRPTSLQVTGASTHRVTATITFLHALVILPAPHTLYAAKWQVIIPSAQRGWRHLLNSHVRQLQRVCPV